MHRILISPDGRLIGDSLQYKWRESNIFSNQEGHKFGSIYRLRKKGEFFRDPFAAPPLYKVREPEFDSSFSAVWGDSLRNAVPRGLGVPKVLSDSVWIRSHIDAPIFDKEDIELVYAYPFGLYKNYKIIDVLVVENYFFILTHQPDATNDQTFDGVLIYRWSGRF